MVNGALLCPYWACADLGQPCDEQRGEFLCAVWIGPVAEGNHHGGLAVDQHPQLLCVCAVGGVSFVT